MTCCAGRPCRGRALGAWRSPRDWVRRSGRNRRTRLGSGRRRCFCRMASAMIERAELCVHRNSTLNAGVMPWSSSGTGEAGGRCRRTVRAGRRSRSRSERRATAAGPANRTAWMICRPWRVDWVRPARSSAARWKERVEAGTARRAAMSPAGKPGRALAPSAGAAGRAGYPATGRRRRRRPPMIPCFQFDGNDGDWQGCWWLSSASSF